MANYLDWFTSAAQDEDLKFDPTALSILQSYVSGTHSLEDTVAGLTAPVQPRPGFSQVGQLWSMVLLLAKDRKEAHDDLISLVEAVFALPAPSRPNEIIWPAQKESSFPQTWRDTLDSLWAHHLRVKSLSDPIGSQWVNYHVFSASLLAAGLLPGAHYWALCLIVDALEKKLDAKHPPARQELDITAVAQYFIYAAKDILENPFRDISDDTGNLYSVAWGNESQLWFGGKGFSLSRWGFWKSRFGELRRSEELGDEAREGARRAEVSMEKAERQGKKKGK